MTQPQPPMISLLLPTRGRPELVNRFFRSVLATTALLDRVEVVLYVDDDDTGSHSLDCSDFSVTRIIGPKLSMGGYNSACLAKAQGEIIVLVNDDIVIRSKGWDERVRLLHGEFEDRIYLGYANDLFKKSKFCTFPILSKKTCALLEEPYPELYRRGFIDVHIFDIFKRLQYAGFDRIRYYNDLVFEHLHYRTGKATFDEVYAYTRTRRFADDPAFISLIPARSAAAHRLAGAIGKGELPAMPKGITEGDIPARMFPAIRLFSKVFLQDRELPCSWRFFLWYWFIGRYLAVHGYLRAFVK